MLARSVVFTLLFTILIVDAALPSADESLLVPGYVRAEEISSGEYASMYGSSMEHTGVPLDYGNSTIAGYDPQRRLCGTPWYVLGSEATCPTASSKENRLDQVNRMGSFSNGSNKEFQCNTRTTDTV
ncbi:hypothetical protein ANCCAN_01297 [Ancylostoma caninum]|uniref:Secreted protein n=1 Tax=Ancylostoma caninum TaxID=29170 RepID=A0A368HA57_ANCCA|nr:hypothetical protein ANCCAN_01297 [Ancylostoma caninum]